MLEQSLFELAIATCFSTKSLSHKLKAHLLHSPASDLMDKARFESACLQLLKDDLDADYARRFRLGDIAHALEVVWPRGMFANGHLPCLDHLFNALMQEHGDYLQYRDGQEQAYARMSARLDPALMATWRMVRRVASKPLLDAHDLQRIVASQQPFFSPLPTTNSAVADNHVHLGGVHYDGLVLMAGMLDLNDAASKPDADRQALAELQRLALALLVRGDWLPYCGEVDEKPQQDLSALLRKTLGGQWQANTPEFLDWPTVAGESVDADPRSPRWLRQQIARSIAEANISKAWHWFLIWLWTHYQHEECPRLLRVAIFYLLNSLMVLRRKLVVDGPGLSRFVQYYDRPLRNSNGHMSSINAAGTLFQGAGDVAELKVTQGKFWPEGIATWLGQLAHASGLRAPNGLMPLSEKDAEKYRAMMERWHYCIHFLRIPSFQNNPQAVWKEAKTLLDNMDKQAGWDRPELLGPSSRALDADHPRLIPSRWVRGLDVAGDENLVKIETYAPALRWLRQGIRRKSREEPASKGLHLSVHAGEDYGHPLSGMRHLDETVQFCEMQSGDRLGHALALGITPADWLARHGEMVIPVDELVDNLVWAWHYAGLMSEHLALAAQVMPMLERRIRWMLPFVPWTHPACIGMASIHMQHKGKKNCASVERIAELHPDVLFKAWQLRRNCYFQLQQWDMSKVLDDLSVAALPDREILSQLCERDLLGIKQKAEYLPEVKLFRTRAHWLSLQKNGRQAPQLACEQKDGIRKVKISLNTSIRMDGGWQKQVTNEMDLLEDHHSVQELEFMHALQDWLLDNYDQKGLLIEANPTSNVYIAKLNKHADHPIFRWYPVDDASLKSGEVNNKFGLRRGPIKVCINTDDPGIMPTTLRTEYALLREAAIEHHATRTDAEAWLERIRQVGLNEFHQKHQAVWL